MAIVEDQMVEVRWNTTQQNYYINKGYEKRKPGEIFLVIVSDLMPNSNKEVKAICDNCGNIYLRKLTKLNKTKSHACSSTCLGKLERGSESRKTYSKEDLKEYFFKYYNEFGVYPTLSNLNKTKGYPSTIAYKYYWKTHLDFLKEIGVVRQDCIDGWYICDENVLRDFYEFGTSEVIIDKLMVKRTWNTIKKKASKLGLTRDLSNVHLKYSKEHLINSLLEFKSKYDRSPTCDDLKEHSMSSIKAYTTAFGGWNNALKLAGLEITRHCVYDKDDIKKEAIDFFNKHNRSPFYNELSFSINTVSNFYERWNDMLIDAGLPIMIKPKKVYEKDDLIKAIKKYAQDFNKTPTATDIENTYDIWTQHFSNKFGSYRQALFEAGLIHANEVNIDYDEYLINSIINLRKLAKTLDRIPSVQEFEDFINQEVSSKSLNRRTLSKKINLTYSEICKKFLPHTILFSSNNKFYLNKLGQKCRSKPEEVISNLFIDNNLEFSYENYYKEFIDIEKNYKFDWVLTHNNKKYMVEYFGYFREEEKNHGLVFKYTTKAKLKIKLCKDNGLTLIDLYPHDIDNNFKGLISKLNIHGIIIEPPLSEAI
ncbi:MAG: homing endonuclease associated repeat-containing protein [Bacillaceae bacterium]